jgi:hypothetical protein
MRGSGRSSKTATTKTRAVPVIGSASYRKSTLKAKGKSAPKGTSSRNANTIVIDIAARKSALVEANATYAYIVSILNSDPRTGPNTDEMRMRYNEMMDQLKIASKGGKQPGTGHLWGQAKPLLQRITERGRVRSAAALEAKRQSDAAANALANMFSAKLNVKGEEGAAGGRLGTIAENENI